MADIHIVGITDSIRNLVTDFTCFFPSDPRRCQELTLDNGRPAVMANWSGARRDLKALRELLADGDIASLLCSDGVRIHLTTLWSILEILWNEDPELSLKEPKQRMLPVIDSDLISRLQHSAWELESTPEGSFQTKLAKRSFDVFLCYNSQDRESVISVAEELKARGILPWLDQWQLRPGQAWQDQLEKQIKKIRSCAVFIGAQGIGPWQDAEIAAFLRRFVKRRCSVIPVILAQCKKRPKMPTMLEGLTWVDFRKTEPDPYSQLLWGITEQSPEDAKVRT